MDTILISNKQGKLSPNRLLGQFLLQFNTKTTFLILIRCGSPGVTLAWNDNGQMITGLPKDEQALTFEYNWDGLRRKVKKDGSDYIHIKYDPMGNRIWRQTDIDSAPITRKYMVDISGSLPVILCETDTSDGSLKKKYYYSAYSEILAQVDDPDITPKRYFYVTDRLGSVRQMIDKDGVVARDYTYGPFGQCLLEGEVTPEPAANPFMFTGQWFDSEIDQYYLRARMYDPAMMRFTSRDPVKGKYEYPLTLHNYLYCGNDPVNCFDPRGEAAWYLTVTGMASFGHSVVGQFGRVWDSKGNSEDISIIGYGAGTPSVQYGVTFGWAPFADTINDLKGAGGSVGGSVKGIGFGVFVTQKGMGYEFSLTSAALMDYIPAEIHGHGTYTSIGALSKAFSRYAFEEGIYHTTTYGEGMAMLNLGAMFAEK